jgi:hypothetical protein
MGFSQYRKTFGFQNVPPKVIPTLEEKFKDYAGRRVVRRRHHHTWKLAMNAKGILWLACADEQCGADDQILLFDSVRIVQQIVLPYYRSLRVTKLYKTPQEQKLINGFLRHYKERAVRETVQQIDKQLVIFQALLEDPNVKTDKLKVQRLMRQLEKVRHDCQTAMLVL